MLLRALPGRLPRGHRSRPAADDGPAGDPAQRDYRQWREERLFALWRLWDAEVRKINPDSCVIPNTGGGATSRLDMTTIGERAPMLVADRQARHGLMAPWAIGMNAKEYRATMGRKPVVGLFSVGVEEAYRWKDSVQSADEIRLWVADLIANGMRPWFTKFAGTLHDPRWLQPVEEIFTWCHGAERYLRNERPLARVGLVYSQQTAWFCGGDRVRERVEDPALGWYQALVEARIPFEMVHDRLLDAEHLAPLQDPDPAQHRGPLRPPVRRARRLRAARRRPRGHLRDLAPRRVGRRAERLRPRRALRRLVRGPPRGAGAELLPASRARDGAADTPCSAGSRTPRGSSTARGSST